MEDWRVSHGCLVRILCRGIFIDEHVCRSDLSSITTVCDSQRTRPAHTTEQGDGAARFAVHAASPVGELQLPSENTDVANVSTVVPLCGCNEPSSSPFEMQNQGVFNFGDSPGCCLREPRKPGCDGFREQQ